MMCVYLLEVNIYIHQKKSKLFLRVVYGNLKWRKMFVYLKSFFYIIQSK